MVVLGVNDIKFFGPTIPVKNKVPQLPAGIFPIEPSMFVYEVNHVSQTSVIFAP